MLLPRLMGAVGSALGIFLTPGWFGNLVVLFALIGEFSLLKGELFRLYVRLGNSDDGLAHLHKRRNKRQE